MHWPWSALGRERSVIHGVPVSRCEHGQSAADEFGQAGVESRQDLFALFDRQSTAGQQVSLHINHKQRITLPELKTRPMRSGARALQGLICEHGHHACMMEGRVFATLSLRNRRLQIQVEEKQQAQSCSRWGGDGPSAGSPVSGSIHAEMPISLSASCRVSPGVQSISSKRSLSERASS